MGSRGPLKRCEHCNATMVEYKHGLTKTLVASLARLYNRNGKEKLNLRELSFSRSQWDSFQQLQYWGLVQGTEKRNGYWSVTNKGESFLTGVTKVNRFSHTYRGKTVKFSGPLLGISDEFSGKPFMREDYIANAEDHEDDQ